MANEFRLQVYTQEAKIVDEQVTSIRVPAKDGYIGVLAYHAPLITALGDGLLTIRHNEMQRDLKISGGFMEVVDNVATILADSVTS